MKMISNLSILVVSLELDQGGGGILHGVLSELSWDAELDGCLNVLSWEGVASELWGLLGHLLVDFDQDRIHHAHGLRADATLWLTILQDFEDIHLEALDLRSLSDLHDLLSACDLGLGLVSGLLVGALGNCFWHSLLWLFFKIKLYMINFCVEI